MNGKIKHEAPLDMMNFIIEQLCVVPSGQIAPNLKQKCIEFNKIKHTPAEKFDFIVSIGETPVEKVNDKMCIGDISTFVKSMCALKQFYLKPAEV
jgi:hypothetical protein